MSRIRTAIFGAGQAGAMIRTWLPANEELICYIDNSKKKQGTEFCGFPVGVAPKLAIGGSQVCE